MRGEAAQCMRLSGGSLMGTTIQKGRRAKDILVGTGVWGRRLTCLGDMAQQHGKESLGGEL